MWVRQLPWNADTAKPDGETENAKHDGEKEEAKNEDGETEEAKHGDKQIFAKPAAASEPEAGGRWARIDMQQPRVMYKYGWDRELLLGWRKQTTKGAKLEPSLPIAMLDEVTDETPVTAEWSDGTKRIMDEVTMGELRTLLKGSRSKGKRSIV